MKKSDVVDAILSDNVSEEQGVFVVGEAIHIRTTSYHHLGRVAGLRKCGNSTFLLLTEASWLALGGRFSEMLEKGTVAEVEPVPNGGTARVNVDHITDVFSWNHPLPTKPK